MTFSGPSVGSVPVFRVQDARDTNMTLGAGEDGKALVYDHDTGKFVLSSAYALLAGQAGGQTLYGGTAANDDITIHGTSNATRTTSYVLLQPSGGYVGIGTATPATALDVAGSATIAGSILLPLSASTQNGVIWKGADRWMHDYHQTDGPVPTIGMNVFIGKEAGNFTMGVGNSIAQEASRNTAVGYAVMTHLTLGHLNTGMGWEAVLGVTTGWGNSGFGVCALCYNEGGSENTGVGVDSMMLKTSGDKNTGVGFRTLYNNIAGSRNVALGYNAGYYETGSDALYIDSRNRTDTAGDKAGAIVYGIMSDTPASQRLRLNANVGIGGAAAEIYSLYVQRSSAVTWAAMGSELSISAAGQIGYGSSVNVDATHSTGDVAALYGLRASAQNRSATSGNVLFAYGASVLTGVPEDAGASGTYIGSNYGLFVDVNVKAGNTIYNNYGIYVAAPTGGGDISIHNAIVTATGNVVFNEAGNAYSDLRVEGDTDANLVVVDASENSVQIGSVSTSKFGVLGATPIAQRTHVADPAGGATVDAEARSAINSILASLETFGFHATS